MKFYRCPICGRVEMVKEGGDTNLICCGREMDELKSRSEDASFEKHVPKCLIEDEKIKVSVGSIFHPMTEEHYIVFIAKVVNDKLEKVDLNPGEEPVATFDYEKDSKIYSYCNLHGLWESGVL